MASDREVKFTEAHIKSTKMYAKLMEKETSHGLKLFKEFLQSKSKEGYLRCSSR